MAFIFENDLCCSGVGDTVSTASHVAFVFGSVADCVVIVVFLRFIFTLELRHLLQTIGLTFGVLLNIALKTFLAEPRPASSCLPGYGAPSGDTQRIASAAVLLISSESKDRDWKSIMCILLVVVECWSRVQLGHHTIAQVAFGGALGVIVSLAWLAQVRRFVGKFHERSAHND